ncbi:hypothetical protein BU25DRAFT_352045 [Macroventuria anomochaeta]|uniref:Uncharacterized protein n=1 Tax=Macroventuria anomochaeta TaxID=301207 RepID=A0ACB6RMD5_9PLEO|nr:uncharacterized protein BU25DRAFT_352045 [Macroventuria anomochaeta]KAF2622555.1 hypothetical protein BU25DRAFT_352045 [Macroventuria anomochaeta]
MAAFLAAPPRTPSPKVRIRSQSFSFDSPSSISRLNASTPIEESPFSKSTGSINTAKTVPQHHVLLPLRTKMSDESMSDTSSAMSISTASSPTKSEHSVELHSRAPRPSDALSSHPPTKRARLSPPHLSLPPLSSDITDISPTSPFAFQDPAFPMTSPWLVRVVLDLYDVHRLSWMDIGDVVGRIYGVQTGSAEVLNILSGNGRVRRVWWD